MVTASVVTPGFAVGCCINDSVSLGISSSCKWRGWECRDGGGKEGGSKDFQLVGGSWANKRQISRLGIKISHKDVRPSILECMGILLTPRPLLYVPLDISRILPFFVPPTLGYCHSLYRETSQLPHFCHCLLGPKTTAEDLE